METIGKLIWLVGYIFAAGTTWIMYYLYMPFANRIRGALNLPRFAITWGILQRYTRISTIMMWLSGVAFVLCIVMGYNYFPLVYNAEEPWPPALMIVLAAVAAVFVFNICLELSILASLPEIQQEAAGLKAEKEVRKHLRKIEKQILGSYSVHNTLFVFNRDTPNEFSCEADHILLTRHQVFLIETKYKSGRITALADAQKWKVISPSGESDMRNALKQVKNTARVLTKQINLSLEIVPLVVIYGNDVQLIDAPRNVVVPDSLEKTVDAFDKAGQHSHIDVSAITQLLMTHTTTDKAVLGRHKTRAKEAAKKAEMEDIVGGSSLR